MDALHPRTFSIESLALGITLLGAISGIAQESPEQPVPPVRPGPVPEHLLPSAAALEPSKPPVTRMGLAVTEHSTDGPGLVVVAVIPEGPAAKAGLQKDDLLQKFDDQILIAPKQLEVLVKSRPVGSRALIEFEREGASQTAGVILDAAAPTPPPSPELVSQDFKVTRRVIRLIVAEGDTETTIALSTKGKRAHLHVSDATTVQFDQHINSEADIPPHLRESIQQIARLEQGRWAFHLPPVDEQPE